MPELNRRRFLTGMGAAFVLPPSAATVVEARRYILGASPQLATVSTPAVPAASAPPLAGPPAAAQSLRRPPPDVLSMLPGNGDFLALTVDDGIDTNVVRLYTEFAKDAGIRLTYFVNGAYRSWTDNAALPRPLVDSGQIQLGNHTWSHPDLTTLSTGRIADEINRNHTFLKDTFGVDARPYLRPPYGKHNQTVRAVAADLGYTATTMWSGSLADSTVVTEDFILKMADTYLRPRNIVIGHLNHPPVTHVYGRLNEIIRSRGLRTVTFNDVFARPPDSK
jgi:peptidoglycan/xylan/chitin deacetylase (PgdA/CDA1 family)